MHMLHVTHLLRILYWIKIWTPAYQSMIRLLFLLLFDGNNEFKEIKRLFCLVFLDGSVKTILRVGHFCKIEKAHISAISWVDIGSVSISVKK